MIRITFLQASLIALAVMLIPAAAQGAFTPDQVWTFDWETYVDLQPGNSNVLSTNWDYATNRWEEVYVDGDGVDNQPGGDDEDEHQGEAAEGFGDDPLGLDQLSMTLTGLEPNTSYAVDAVVMAQSSDSADNWGAVVSFSSSTIGRTAFDCGNKSAAHINMDFNDEWLARSSVGTTTSNASGEITVYFNENAALDWSGSLGGSIVDGLIYAKVADIAPTPTDLITSADRKNGVTSTRLPAGSCDGEADPLASDDYGLRLGARTFSDRVFHVDDISDGLIGADYVRTFLNDKGDAEGDFSYDVTLTDSLDNVFLMVLVDDRFELGGGELQTMVDTIVADFAEAGDFVDTGLDVDFSDSSTPHPLSAFGMMVPTKDSLGDPITYTFSAVPNGSISTYLIAALEEAPSTQIPGDANGDQKVDAADVSIMAANWGSAGASWAMGDFSKDGTVGPEDARILAQNWGTGNSSNEAASTIPEPSMAMMLFALLPVLWLRRQR